MIAVSDQEILDAMRSTARLGGVFGEPAGVTGVAGLKKAIAQGLVDRDSSAVVVITGNGLKDIQSAKQSTGQPLDIEANFEILERELVRSKIIQKNDRRSGGT